MTDTLKITTSRFGEIEVAADKVINFPNSIPGFQGLNEYVLLDHDEGGLFKWLQSVTDPAVAFLLTAPGYFKADYVLPKKAFPMTSIDVTGGEDTVIMTMVCFPSDNQTYFTLNLKGPIVFNLEKMSAIQYIVDIDSENYPCDFRVEVSSLSEQEDDSASASVQG